mmetsp:Transcript_41102/g.113270  ORF Transcript_41102/g.113270 Transcript_41102/m.113270 type:complete len:206 (+) Transcript_41102:428-1045(+)
MRSQDGGGARPVQFREHDAPIMSRVRPLVRAPHDLHPVRAPRTGERRVFGELSGVLRPCSRGSGRQGAQRRRRQRDACRGRALPDAVAATIGWARLHVARERIRYDSGLSGHKRRPVDAAGSPLVGRIPSIGRRRSRRGRQHRRLRVAALQACRARWAGACIRTVPQFAPDPYRQLCDEWFDELLHIPQRARAPGGTAREAQPWA